MASDPPYVETAAAAVNASKSSSSFVIGALRREMEAEDASGAEGTAIHRLAVVLQAALVDAGFVAATNPPGSHRLRLLKDWSAGASSTLTVKYTIPELVEAAEEGKTAVVLNYSLMSNFVMIYACVPGAQSEVRRLCLELPRLAPFLYLDSNAAGAAEEEKEILEIWRVLKDELCLPLMISLCQLNGLSLPPCLMALPDEMKAMILELVPGVDLAKVQCTCKELKGLAADNGLWERKFVLELNTIGEGSRWSRDWKKWFQVGWTRKVDNTRRQVEENARRQRKRPRPRFMGNSPPSPHNFLLGDEGLEFTDYYSGQYMDYRWWNSPASPPNFMAFDDDSDRLPYTTYWV